MSIAGGVSEALVRGQQHRMRLYPDFHQVSRQWAAKPYSEEEIEAFKSAQAETGIKMVVAHDSYLLNLGAPDDELRKRSVEGFIDELERCEVARRTVSDRASRLSRRLGRGRRHHDHRAFDRRGAQVLRRFQNQGRAGDHGRAGQQSRLFSSRRWSRIFDAVKENDRLRLCFDTEHAFAAGYDLRSERATSAHSRSSMSVSESSAWSRFISTIRSSPFTRASIAIEHIGKGYLELEPFHRLLHDPRFLGIPMCLETEPGPDMKDIAEDLATLRKLVESQDGP